MPANRVVVVARVGEEGGAAQAELLRLGGPREAADVARQVLVADVIGEDRLAVDRREQPADAPRLRVRREAHLAPRAVHEAVRQLAGAHAVPDAPRRREQLRQQRRVERVVRDAVPDQPCPSSVSELMLASHVACPCLS